MRFIGLSVAIACALLPACASPNPAWLTPASAGTTEGPPASTGSESASSGSTVAPGTTDAPGTTGEPTTGDIQPGTTSTATTAGPGTTGPDSSTGVDPITTTGGVTCSIPANPADLELTVSSNKAQTCGLDAPRQFHAEVLGQAGVNSWKFNFCPNQDECKDPQVTCADGEHLVFTFDGPAELVPTFHTGQCVHLDFIARAADPNNVQTCKLRALAIADAGYVPYAPLYVGAVNTPGTAGLPGNIDWSKVFGFSVVSEIGEPCEDQPVCQPPAGTYKFAVTWLASGVEHVVGEGETFEETHVVLDTDQNKVEVPGTFTDIRSHIDPGPCTVSQDFKFAWLADAPGP